MDQSIKIKIAGKEYPLKATSPEMEQLMRLASEDINKMLSKYDDRYSSYDLVDKLAFVALNETFAKLKAQKLLAMAGHEAEELKGDLESYLNGITK